MVDSPHINPPITSTIFIPKNRFDDLEVVPSLLWDLNSAGLKTWQPEEDVVVQSLGTLLGSLALHRPLLVRAATAAAASADKSMARPALKLAAQKKKRVVGSGSTAVYHTYHYVVTT